MKINEWIIQHVFNNWTMMMIMLSCTQAECLRPKNQLYQSKEWIHGHSISSSVCQHLKTNWCVNEIVNDNQKCLVCISFKKICVNLPFILYESYMAYTNWDGKTDNIIAYWSNNSCRCFTNCSTTLLSTHTTRPIFYAIIHFVLQPPVWEIWC